MPVYTLKHASGGPIEVDFPFEAYECQLQYMQSVLDALGTHGRADAKNALLESPTGTGKTVRRRRCLFSRLAACR